MENMINAYYQKSIEKVPQCLKNDTWMPTNIPIAFYSTLGEVLYGPPFIKRIRPLPRTSKNIAKDALELTSHRQKLLSDGGR